MATLKFKGASPYLKKVEVPAEDYLYAKYLKEINLQSSNADEKVLNVALFGVGRIGILHLVTLTNSNRVNLMYIVDDDESRWEPIKKQWKVDNVTFLLSKNADTVYKDAKIDTVIVASPTITHEEFITKSLAANKDVFCEKPIAKERSTVIKCYDAAAKAGKILFCGFNRRFDVSLSAVRSRVRKGEVGHVHTIKFTSRSSPLPSLQYLTISGAIFHDLMVHDIDMMTWVLGEFPIKVSVQAHAHIPEIRDMNDFDIAVGTFHFPSGTLGIIDLARYSSYGYDQRFEVFGPHGMVAVDSERPTPSVTTQYGLQGVRSSPNWFSFFSRFRFAYETELHHFLDVVQGKAKSLVNPKEILAVSKIASACEESARTGKMVELTWAADELPVYDS